jgi:flagellar biosynthesis GTPase FlhF
VPSLAHIQEEISNMLSIPDEELTPEQQAVMAEYLTELAEQEEAKIDGFVSFLRAEQAKANWKKEEAKRLNVAAKAIENKRILDEKRKEREKQEAERKAEEAEKARKEAEERARNTPDPVQKAATGAQQAVPMSKTLPQPKPSKWTDEQKAVNKRIVATIAKILPLYIAGHSELGYELAAREIVKAIVNGKINNLKVEY